MRRMEQNDYDVLGGTDQLCPADERPYRPGALHAWERCRRREGTIDEIPMACKDIDAVERTADFDS